VSSPLVQPSHVYSLLDVHEVASEGVTYRLLKIRNPYAKEKWKGEASETNINWTQDLRLKLGFPKDGIDGVFFMNINDFIKNFAHCTICKIREDWAEVRETMQVSNVAGRGEVLQMDMQLPSGAEATTGAGESVECCISLAQLEHRAQRHLGNVSPLGFVLFRQVKPQGASTGAHGLAVEGVVRLRGDKSIRSMDCWLQTDSHYVLVPLHAHQSSQLQVTCTCVSSRPVTFCKRPLEGEVLQLACAEYKRRGGGRDPFSPQPSAQQPSSWWWS